MSKGTVLVVEDHFVASLEVEQALIAADYEVCAVARLEEAALDLAAELAPDFAVVDIALDPGDGRVVAREMARRGTAVLFVTGQCEEVASLSGAGALGCLPKPYDPDDVPAALAAVEKLHRGLAPGALPDHMLLLT